MAGEYSIADMATWPWIVPFERQGQKLEDFPNLSRWFKAVGQRPAVRAAYAIEPEGSADKEAYRFLYGQTAKSADELGEKR